MKNSIKESNASEMEVLSDAQESSIKGGKSSASSKLIQKLQNDFQSLSTKYNKNHIMYSSDDNDTKGKG